MLIVLVQPEKTSREFGFILGFDVKHKLKKRQMELMIIIKGHSHFEKGLGLIATYSYIAYIFNTVKILLLQLTDQDRCPSLEGNILLFKLSRIWL